MDQPTKTLDDKMNEAQEMLDEFEEIHNLNKVSVPTDMDHILNLSYPQLEKLQAIQCAEYSYQLAQFSYYVQRVCNKEQATLRWLNEEIERMAIPNWFDFDSFVKYDVRMKLIARNNEPMRKLLRQAAFSHQKIERISFLGARIDKMADMMAGLHRAKNQQVKAG